MSAADIIKPESILNREGNKLPFGLYNPATEGKLTWMCGYDQDQKITSVFCMDVGGGRKEKKSEYLKDLAEAKRYRDELVKNGWMEVTPPKVTFTYDGKEERTSLNRSQKRAMQKKMKKMQTSNPFKE